MEINRETVNEWLERHRRGREWLAEKCDVGISAVGNWLNKRGTPRPIPAEHQLTIQRLMEEDAAAEEAKPPQYISLRYEEDSPEYARIEEAAHRSGEKIRDWARRTLNDAAEVDVVEFVRQAQERVADEVKGYNGEEDGELHELPFLGAVAAGEPAEAPRDEKIRVPHAYPRDHFVVEVNGASMEPDYPDGSRWIIDARDKYTPGHQRVCVVSDGEGSYLKRWNRHEKVFESINPDHKDVIPGYEATLQGYPVERLD